MLIAGGGGGGARSARANLASDVIGLLQHLGVGQADVFGFSVGGGVGMYPAIKHPELVRKLIGSSASFHPDGDRPENKEAVGEMTDAMIAGTPMEQDYLPSRRTRTSYRICSTS